MQSETNISTSRKDSFNALRIGIDKVHRELRELVKADITFRNDYKLGVDDRESHFYTKCIEVAYINIGNAKSIMDIFSIALEE
ncbi:MAG: hypothetical protein ABSF14_23775 [Terriglobia bacterium]|jgi:hypothetical protein